MSLPIQVKTGNVAPAITLNDVVEIASTSAQVLANVRTTMLAPDTSKLSPNFSAAQLATLCGVEKSTITYHLNQNPHGLPTGSVTGGNRKRIFSLPEAIAWVKQFAGFEQRPENAPAFVWASGNFKGGVTKTTTALAVAQGLSLRGKKGLIIDVDPQGSMTSLFGMIPDSQIAESDTVVPYLAGGPEAPADLRYAIRRTYWEGIDLIPSCSSLFAVEFIMPTRQMHEKQFRFWNTMRKGIEPLLYDYDFIIFDTPPALSYLTTSVFFAADGIIMPIPPSPLDFASSTQFWGLFSDLCNEMSKRADTEAPKEYQFINVLITLSEQTTSARITKEWIDMAYGKHVLRVEIPKAEASRAAAALFGTVYDNTASRETNKVREAYDTLCETLDQQMNTYWNKWRDS